MKITKEELENIIKEEVEKALEEREMSDEEVLDFIETNSAKEIWKSLGEEEKAEISNIAQKASNELYARYPKFVPPFIMKAAFTPALDASKGSVENFSAALKKQINIYKRERGIPN